VANVTNVVVTEATHATVKNVRIKQVVECTDEIQKKERLSCKMKAFYFLFLCYYYFMNSESDNKEEYLNIKKLEFKNYDLLSNLLNINQIPKELNVLGNLNLLGAIAKVRRANINKKPKILCIVGSRKCTTYGKEVTDYLVSGLSGQNIIIVSGLAAGIDSTAHRAALKYKIPTIAFPGSGLSDNVLYPANNIKLKKEILEDKGALISEYKEDERSQIYFFPARNRLMAAISDLVLVVEAEEKSGTQITARLALEYGKEVAIVPGSIFSAYSRGTAKLFKDGAHPVTSSEDILELLNIKSIENKSLFENIECIESYLDDKMIGGGSATTTNENKLYDTLTEKERMIMLLLSAPLDKDALIEESGLLAHEALTAITSLESKRFIIDNFGEIKKIK
jgi:DNA protecting protein DprA